MRKYIHQVGNWIKNEKSFFYFACIVFAFFGLMLFVEIGNKHFESNDFRVFYQASKNYWNGKAVYGLSFGLDSGFFKYSPFILLIFSPALLVDFFTASVLYYMLNISFLLLFFYRLFSFLKENYSFKSKRELLFYLLVFASIVGHFIRELHLGNTNIILLCFVLLIIHLVKQKKQLHAGLLFVLIVLVKPYLAVLILPVLLFNHQRMFWSSLICGFGALVISLLFFGMNEGIVLYIEWFQSMISHSDYLTSNNTLWNFIGKLTNTKPMSQLGLPMFVLLSMIFYAKFRKNKSSNPEIQHKQMALFMFLLLAVFPLLLLTDTQHFLFSTPLIAMLAVRLYEKGLTWFLLSYVVLIVFYLGEAKLFLGQEIGNFVTVYGGIGWANLILIIWSLALHWNQMNRKTTSTSGE